MNKPVSKSTLYIRSLFDAIKRHPIRWMVIGLAVFCGLSLVDVPYTVEIGEVSLVRRFGRFLGEINMPGLHFRFPWGIDHVDVIEANKIHTLELNARVGQEYFTGDENIVDVKCILQYQIENASFYLFHVQSPELLMLQQLKETLISCFGNENIDKALSLAREKIEDKILSALSHVVKSMDLGIHLVSVNLQQVLPPKESIAAFQDVVTAKEDRYLYTNLAAQHKTEVLALAHGTAERIVQGAKAESYSRIETAKGAAKRFNLVLNKYRADPLGTKLTEYYKTISKVASLATLYLIKPGQGASLEVNLLDQVYPPTGAFEASKEEKKVSHQLSSPMDNVLLPEIAYDNISDRTPGSGVHQENNTEVRHVELPSTTLPIPKAELEKKVSE